MLAEEDWVQHGRTLAVLVVALLIVWMFRSMHFKFGQLEATLDKTEATVTKAEKQLNGRDEGQTTVSADVAEIRKLVKFQGDQINDVHANIVVADGQRDGLRTAMVKHVALVEELAGKVESVAGRVDLLELRLAAEAVDTLSKRVDVLEEKAG